MTPREARYALAASIEAVLPDGWTTYAAPPEGITAPAVVLAPRQPYRRASTFCDEEVRISVLIIIQRNASVDGLDAMDDLITTVIRAINASSVMATWEEVTDLGPVQESGGVDYLTSTINVTVQTEKGTP